MKLSKRTTTIILWAVSIGLLAGMVISFTPGLTQIGQSTGQRGTVQFTVNGQNVYEFDVQEARRNPLYASVTEGEVGADLQRLMVDQIVRQAVLQQAASRMNVSNGEVRRAVNEFREERGVAGSKNDRAYLNLIQSGGFTDQSFREYLKEQLRIGKFQTQLVGDVSVSDLEVETYYETHLSSYQDEERIFARQIVVEDQQSAEELRRRALKGEEFAALAREYSVDLADRDGALGAGSDETDPRPVGRPALPTAVANAAFALRGAGVTDVIETNQRYFVVGVEEYVPAAPRPFEEVQESVREDALNAKMAGIMEAELDRLRDEATVSFPAGSELSFDNPVVAEVNGVEIRAAHVDEALYTSPQIQQSLSPQTADLIVGLFKPTVLNQVIDTEVAYQAAPSLGVPFVGTRAAVAQAAINYLGRDATATDGEMEVFYEENLAAFTLPAEAVVTRADFSSEAQAAAFRDALLAGEGVEEAAEAQDGALTNLGLLKPGALDVELDTALFGTNAFEPLPDSDLDVSDLIVLQVAEEAVEGEEEPEGDSDSDAEATEEEGEADLLTRELFVVLVAERTPELVRPLTDVRAQVEAAVIAEKRQAERLEWLTDRREEADVVEHALNEFDAFFDGVTVGGGDLLEDLGLTDEAEGAAGESTDD